MTAQRRLSFGAIAENYHRFRTPMLPAAVDWLVPDDCGVAAEVGAGTGLFTQQLTGRVPKVYAVDPDARMRAQLAAACPEADVRAGSAESIPVRDASVHAVFAACAWHWFDPDRAAAEIARVLRPGGVLGVAWHHRDNSVDWIAGVNRLVRQGEFPSDRRPGHFVLPEHAPFGDVEQTVFPWHCPMTTDEFVGSLCTYSNLIVLDDADRDRVLDSVRDYLASHPDTAGRDTLEVPFTATCFRTHLRAS